MNLRESVINAACVEFEKGQARLLAALRRVAIDNALVADRMQLLRPEEAEEIDAALAMNELPYVPCSDGICPRCE